MGASAKPPGCGACALDATSRTASGSRCFSRCCAVADGPVAHSAPCACGLRLQALRGAKVRIEFTGSAEVALANLAEALQLFIESCCERGIFDEVLKDRGFEPDEKDCEIAEGQRMVRIPLPLVAQAGRADSDRQIGEPWSKSLKRLAWPLHARSWPPTKGQGH